ncbi:MAG: FHA domain-containing protein, partial [Muribaculaceae bacterium]|nr:FHA domain-containing protein [Muribaculaceae bacterium]
GPVQPVHRPTVVGLPEVAEPQLPKAPSPAVAAAPANAPMPGQSAAPAAKDPAKYRGTVNVYTAAAPVTNPSFSLSPIQKVNEPVAPTDLSFEGQEAILNRANTDPENLSITSRQQASIARRDGKWVITDLSDQQTTFVHPAKSGHVLSEGDIILLGNRLFIFHEKE